jgi:hypothetical protein
LAISSLVHLLTFLLALTAAVAGRVEREEDGEGVVCLVACLAARGTGASLTRGEEGALLMGRVGERSGVRSKEMTRGKAGREGILREEGREGEGRCLAGKLISKRGGR